MGLSYAYVAHNLCTIWYNMAPLPVSHKCAHRLCTLTTTHRAFTMGVNRPYLPCFTFNTQSMQLCRSLYSFFGVWIPHQRLIHVERGFQNPLWTLYTSLRSAVLTYTVSEIVWKFYIGLVFSEIPFLGFCQSLSIYCITSEAKYLPEVFICWISVEINYRELTHGLLIYLK